MAVAACPQCATQLEIPDDLIGRTVRCATCGNPFEASVYRAYPDQDVAGRVAQGSAPVQSPSSRPSPAFADEDQRGYGAFSGLRRDVQPHRGVLIMVLGIVSVVLSAMSCMLYALPALVALPLGIVSWVMANRDLKSMAAGTMDPDGRSQTLAGKICGIIGTAISILAFLAVLVLLGFVFIMIWTDGKGFK